MGGGVGGRVGAAGSLDALSMAARYLLLELGGEQRPAWSRPPCACLRRGLRGPQGRPGHATGCQWAAEAGRPPPRRPTKRPKGRPLAQACWARADAGRDVSKQGSSPAGLWRLSASRRARPAATAAPEPARTAHRSRSCCPSGMIDAPQLDCVQRRCEMGLKATRRSGASVSLPLRGSQAAAGQRHGESGSTDRRLKTRIQLAWRAACAVAWVAYDQGSAV